MTTTTLAASATDRGSGPGAILNLSCYKFVPLDGLADKRATLRQRCHALSIKGTILLSPEGINFFVAGPPPAIHALVEHLRAWPELADVQPKESYSDDQPFSRMLVRIKQEIIAFGVPEIDPSRYTSRKLPAAELKRWLDEGRDLTLLDVRNNYEVQVGTFEHALAIDVDHFRDFPQAAENLPAPTREKPIVMFCTGGIRCEKAGPLMERLGFREIYQLDGGILKYFEEVGGDHWRGECFVFDKRAALDPHLEETATTQCYACQQPLTPADQASPHYVPGSQCPHCYDLVAAREQRQRATRQARLQAFQANLPGSQPYDNLRPLNVPQRFDGLSVLDFVVQLHPHVSRAAWAETLAAGRIRLGNEPVSADRVVRAGMGLRHLIPDTIEPAVNAAIEIVHDDANLVVVNKPAPLPVHACGRFNRHTLEWLLQQVYRPQRLKLVHRLDADTSGLMVIARHRRAATALHQLFQTNQVDKRYLARIHGWPADDAFVETAAIGAGPAAEGLRTIDPAGLSAETRFVVRQRFVDGTALVEAQPITGRTHQIRLHLWHAGHPIVGDSAYLPDRQLGHSASRSTAEPPLCLHAWQLSFPQPLPLADADDSLCRWEAGWPIWADANWAPTATALDMREARSAS